MLSSTVADALVSCGVRSECGRGLTYGEQLDDGAKRRYRQSRRRQAHGRVAKNRSADVAQVAEALQPDEQQPSAGPTAQHKAERPRDALLRRQRPGVVVSQLPTDDVGDAVARGHLTHSHDAPGRRAEANSCDRAKHQRVKQRTTERLLAASRARHCRDEAVAVSLAVRWLAAVRTPPAASARDKQSQHL